MRFLMKLAIAGVLVVTTTLVAFANVSNGDTIRLDYKDGTTTYIKDDGTELPALPELYTEDNEPELYCLAMNIYHESRSDNLAGQAAVADVVLNRVNDKRYPSTICKVVKQGPVRESWKTRQTPDPTDAVFHPVRHRCQFSWWCDGKDDVPKQPMAWRKAQEIAYHIVNSDQFRGITEGSTHYHATYVDPKWNRSMLEMGRIGEHIFYKSLPK